MSKRFTEAVAALTLVLSLQACAGRVEAPASTAAAPAPGAETALPAQAATPGSAVPATLPEVQPRNAAAFARATEALRDGQLDTAEVLLLEVTSDQPELAGPWINLAEVYNRQGRADEAEQALLRAVQANPANCVARNELGVLLRKRGEFDAAEVHYRACLDAVPDYGDAYLNLGILYDLYLGRLEEALAAYRRYQALAAEPDRRVAGWVVDLERRLGV
ncbi:MAG: tetratricopeptide repeat protein [Pseudomonadales bacterium]